MIFCIFLVYLTVNLVRAASNKNNDESYYGDDDYSEKEYDRFTGAKFDRIR